MATMSPKDFRRWRKAMDLSQKDAAEALGLKRRVVQYYEKGERDGENVDIPKYVRLACYALLQGVKDYKGPPKDEVEEAQPEPESPPEEPPAEVTPEAVLPKAKAAKGRAKAPGRKAAGKAAVVDQAAAAPKAPDGTAEEEESV